MRELASPVLSKVLDVGVELGECDRLPLDDLLGDWVDIRDSEGGGLSVLNSALLENGEVSVVERHADVGM